MSDVASMRKNDATVKQTSSLMTNVESILRNDASKKVTSSLGTDIVSIRTNDSNTKLILTLETNVTSIRENDLTAKPTSSLDTGVASMRTNDVTEKLTSSLATDVSSIRKNDAAGKLSSNLETGVLFIHDSIVSTLKGKPKLETDVACICQTNAPDLTFTTNLAPIFSLLPFPITALHLTFIVSQALTSLIIQLCRKIMLHGLNPSFLFFNHSFIPFI